MDDGYQYTPLDPSSSELRIVSVVQGKWDDPIECHLHHVHLDEKPTYEALSYTWGDTPITSTRHVYVSGHRFAVTTNLEIALRFLRLENEPRNLWIDAICINQDDTPERNREVQRMRRIYKSASKVLMWLGEGSEDSDEGMVEIQDIARLVDEHSNNIPLPTGTPEQFDQLQFNLGTRNWPALFSILERKYWTRIWVVQEIASAGFMDISEDGTGDKGLIGCGRIWLPKHILNKTILFISYLLRSTNNFTTTDNDLMEPFRTMESRGPIPAFHMYSALALEDKNSDIVDLMRTTSFLDSTDPRDKIYALLGLAKEIPGFSPDYAKPTQQTYQELISTLITRDQSLACLRGNRTMKVDFSPSWAAPQCKTMDLAASWRNSEKFYRASASQGSDAQFDEGLKLLCCSGIMIGSLETVVGPLEPVPSMHSGRTSEKLTAYNNLWEYARTAGQAHRDILWRTLVMDLDIFDFENPIFPAPLEFEKQYSVLVEGNQLPGDFKPQLPEEMRPLKFFERYCRCFDECTAFRCFFVTESMHMGLGPYFTKAGDVVAVLTGGDFCFVLRPKGDYFEVVGEAYVHGVMRGELMKRDENGNLINEREFILC